MPIYAEQGATRELITAGNYIARCYQMIEIGTIDDGFGGSAKKVRIGWELPEELRTFDEAKGPQPLIISAEYTLSTGKKSNLRAILASWRGKDFTPEEAKKFDITTILGAPCLLNIIHKNGVADPSKVYEKISSISPLPKGTKAPKAILEPVSLSYAERAENVYAWDQKFNALPEFIRKKMMDSAEFQKILRPEETTVQQDEPVPDGENVGELPF